jgi:hypothetical protein
VTLNFVGYRRREKHRANIKKAVLVSASGGVIGQDAARLGVKISGVGGREGERYTTRPVPGTEDEVKLGRSGLASTVAI